VVSAVPVSAVLVVAAEAEVEAEVEAADVVGRGVPVVRPDGRAAAADRDVRAGEGDEDGSVRSVRAVGTCGQIAPSATSGGSRRPPSCQTHASVDPGAGS
jgi:hypothetical protein